MLHAGIYNGLHRFWRIREDAIASNISTQDRQIQEYRREKPQSNIRSCQKSHNEKDRVKCGVKKVRFNI